MPTDGARMFEAYRQMDAMLAAKGWHLTSAPWLEALESFWTSGATRMVVRKGRQSGGSTTMERAATCTGLFGQHCIARGSRGHILFVSNKMSEARERLHGIWRQHEDLEVATRMSGDTLEVVDPDYPPIVYVVQPCNARNTRGAKAVAIFEDEMAVWSNDDGSANPADEVDAALAPSIVTEPNGRIYSISSPNSNDDFHAELFQRGDTADQRVYAGASWFWNPIISEAETHRLQADPRKWSREFAAIPQEAKLAAFDRDAVLRAFQPAILQGESYAPFGLMDPSSGKKDSWTFAVAHWHDVKVGGPRRLVFDLVDGIGGNFWSQQSGTAVVARIASAFRRRGVRQVFSDQRESLMLASAFAAEGFKFTELAWTSARKERAVTTTRRWLADGTPVFLQQHQQLKEELLGFEEKIAPSGALTFGGGRGVGGRDDYVALVITAAMAASEPRGDGFRGLPGTPVGGSALRAAYMAIPKDEWDRQMAAAERGLRHDWSEVSRVPIPVAEELAAARPVPEAAREYRSSFFSNDPYSNPHTKGNS